jgi:hypothetical protein
MTTIHIHEDQFYIDGKPTYQGRSYRGWKIEGLLMNSRMVQATFDDENLETRHRWAYPDTGEYSAERNTNEFIAALPTYRQYGLLGVTVNFQGGSPEGYSQEQPWINNAYYTDGSFKPNYLDRMRRVIAALDENGLVAILGIFYFGQDQHLMDEAAVQRAVDNTIHWVFDQGFENVLIEVNNECNVPRYVHPILMPDRVHELIERVRHTTQDGRRLLVGTSYGGNFVPLENVVRSSDFLLLHGNGVTDPNRIAEMVDQVRAVPGFHPMPILFNEDDHFDFDKGWNNWFAAVSRYASWGFFDPGKNDYIDGYQSPPVQWMPNTDRKQGFFRLLNKIVTG